MHQAAIEQGADLDPSPELRHAMPLVSLGSKHLRNGAVGRSAVVIGDGKVLEPDADGLMGKLLGAQAAIAAVGVAVQVDSRWAALSPNRAQHLGQGMVVTLE